ncbi:PepSY domain-containing protein [Desulfotalea psychrophila]|nr:PepSY domain-containing protein [Desulfotalea psychrophila]
MKRKKYAVAAVLLASFFMVSPSFAGHDGNKSLIRYNMLLAQTQKTLSQVVEEQAKKTAATVIEAELEMKSLGLSEQKQPVYKIVTYKKGGRVKYYIDSVTGKVLLSKKKGNWNPLDDDMLEAEAMSKAKISMGRAITLAEKKFSGKAIEAEIDEDDDVLYYKVKLVPKSGVIKALVDPKVGTPYEVVR